MKSKLCWAAFIPLTVVAVAVKLLDTFAVVQLPGNGMTYISLCAVLLMFAVNIVFTALDKETSPAYLLSRNIPSAIFALLAAAMIASKSSLNVILNLQSRSINPLTVVTSLFGMLTAVSLVVISLSHIQGRNFMPNLALFFLSMPAWGGLMLITQFLENRTLSVKVIDPLTLFAYVFAMIYLFKLSMVISTVDGKNPVKAMFLYGFPLAGLGVVLGVNGIASIVLNGLDYSENIVQFAFLALAGYVVFFNIELTRLSRKKKEQIVKYDLDDFDESRSTYGDYGLETDDLIVSGEENTDEYDYSLVTPEADEFVTAPDENYTDDYDYSYGYGDGSGDDLVVAEDFDDSDAILVEKAVVESFEEGVVQSNEDERAHDESADSGYSDGDDEKLAKIDKLLQDINN